MIGAILPASPVVAETDYLESHIGEEEELQIRATLTNLGVGSRDIETIISDVDLALAVPVEIEVTETFPRAPLMQRDMLGGASVAPFALGTSCTGKSASKERRQDFRNVFGNELGRFTIVTHWCYNGSRVTYSSSTVTGTVTNLGTVGGLVYESHQLSEAWQTFGGKSNGQVRSQANGKFKLSPIRIGSIATYYPIAITKVRYDGTAATGGSCDGCKF